MTSVALGMSVRFKHEVRVAKGDSVLLLLLCQVSHPSLCPFQKSLHAMDHTKVISRLSPE